MINEVILSIKEGEDEATRIAEDGRKAVRSLISEARQQSEQEAASIVEAARAESEKKLKHAEVEARKKAEQVLSDGEQNIERQMQQARAKLDDAVQLILGRLA